MKILIINDSCKEVGGAETYIFEIKKLLEKKKHKVYFFGFDKEEKKLQDRYTVKNDQSIKGKLHKLTYCKRVYTQLKEYIKEINPDIIHIHNNYLYTIPVLKACQTTKAPKIQTVHDWGMICPTAWSVYKKTLKKCSAVEGIATRCVTKRCISPQRYLTIYYRNKRRIELTRETIKTFICPSKELQKYYKDHNFTNVLHIPHFFEIKEMPNKVNTSKENTIAYLGAIIENKGVQYLIDAMPEIIKEIPDIQLKITGDGNYRKTIEKKIKEKKIEKYVTLYGRVPHNEMKKKYEETKVVIMPSIWMENSPFIIYEAMAATRPVIGSNIGGIPDLVQDNVTGYVVEPTNTKELAQKIIKILKEKDKYKQLAQNARKRLEQEYNIKKHIQRILEVYKDATEGNKSNERRDRE